jgi:hypothetical protein
MDRSTIRILRIALALLLAWAVRPALGLAADEDDVRAAFKDFQQALKAGDPEKIWPLMDKSSQDEAEKNAKTLRDGYDKSDAKKKADIEKAMGLSADEMAKLTGKLYTKSKRFLGKKPYDEIPTSKIDPERKVTINGDKATLFYIEADGDKVEIGLVRQDRKWKFSPK